MPQKQFRAIVLPLQIVKQSDFAKKIQSIDENITNSTQYLKKFISKNNEICYQSANQITKIISINQKKLNPSNKLDQTVIRFMNDCYQIFHCMETQINRVNILMNNRKHDHIKKLNEIIGLKLEKVGQSVNAFTSMIRYIKKSDYFQDIGKNSIKYYSFQKNKQKHKKIIKIQQELQKKLQAINTLKGQIRDMMNQLYTKIKDLYENIRFRIQQFKKAVLVILQKSIQHIYGFNKIQQVSERAEQQSQVYQKQSIVVKKQRTEVLATRQQIRQIKKQKMMEYDQQANVKQIFLSFMQSFLITINSTTKQLQNITNDKQFAKFDSEKAFMYELLPQSSCFDIHMIIQGQRAFLNIYNGINKYVTRQVFQQIFKLQKLYFTRFIQAVQKIQDYDIESMSIQNQHKLIMNVREQQKKYILQQIKWKRQLQDKLIDTINRIRGEFSNKGQMQVPRKKDKKSELFTFKYFQVLKLSYFEHNKLLGPFLRSEHIISYQQLTKSNRLKSILMQIDNNRNDSKNKQKQTTKVKSSCCGLIRNKIKQIKQQKIDKILKLQEIDHYSCALKDGFFLCQGVITLYNQYISFKSSFNPKTLFGSTHILVPKFEIYEFIKGRLMMSQMITVVTRRGSLQFTSFFVDPFDSLVQIYMNNRNTEFDIATERPMQKQQQKLNELQELRKKLQEKAKINAQRQNFRITNSRCIRQQKQVIVIQYKYSDQQIQKSNTLSSSNYSALNSLKVTLRIHQNSLQYIFDHSINQNLSRQKRFEEIIKNIIDEDRNQKCDNFNKQIKQKQKQKINLDDNISFQMDEQVSIIGQNQKHRFDFGQYDVRFHTIQGNQSKKSPTQMDLHKLMQQNQTKIFQNQVNSPKNNKKIFKINSNSHILKHLDESSIMKPTNNMNYLQPDQPIIINQIQTQQKSIRNIGDQNNKTNQLYVNKLDKSQISQAVSQNASTVKLSDRKIRSNNKISYAQNKVNEDQIRKQGTKNLIILFMIALGLISLINIII